MSASAPLPSAGPGSGTWAPPAVGSAAARRRPHRRGARPGCHGALVVRAPVRRPAAVLEPARRVGRAGRLPTLRFVDADDAPAAASTTTLLRDATSVTEVRCSTVRCGSPGAGGPGPHDDTGSRHGTRSDRVLAAIDEQGLLPRAYGQSPAVPDASSPMAVAFGLLGRKDARGHRLVDALLHRLGAGPYVYRYPPGGDDGFSGTEGAFLPTSFLAVTALAQLGRVDEAWTGSAPPSRAYWPRRSTRRPGRCSATHRCV